MQVAANCAVIIPCYNESATIGSVVSAVRQHVSTVFVVDDGSTDETGGKATLAGARVLRHPTRKGKGCALETGWRQAQQAGFQHALSMDGDGQHSPADIPLFLKCFEQTGARLIAGNRMHSPQGMPWIRRTTNRWMSARISALANQSLPDTQCGFRLMHLAAWSALPVSATHFEVESEVLLQFAKAGQRIAFVPVQVIYKTEQSKINPLRDTVRWLRWYYRVRVSSGRADADILAERLLSRSQRS